MKSIIIYRKEKMDTSAFKCALFCIMVGRKVNFYAVQNYVFVFLV